MQIHEDKQMQHTTGDGLQRSTSDFYFNPRNYTVSKEWMTLQAKGNGWSLNYIGVLVTTIPVTASIPNPKRQNA